jgi:hypothetical protein
MTMPLGSTEEPETIMTERQSVPVHVVSSDSKPSKSIAPEFGRWRTFIVGPAVGQDSATPGARRLCNRSLQRHRVHILVNTGGSVVPSVAGFPSIAVSGTAIQNPFSYPVSVVLAGFTATQVLVNGILVGASNGTYIVPGYGALSVTFTVLGTTTASGIAQAQSSNDGVLVGTSGEINSNVTMTPGVVGGFLDIGTNLRWEAQSELWVAYPVTNTGPVLVSVCDEVYASDPESYKHMRTNR